jgi:hypothetical protein
MFKLIERGIIKTRVIFTLLLVFILSGSFKSNTPPIDWFSWTNNCLKKSYNQLAEPKLRRWELSINELGFIRLRKFYQKNKQIYYSFNLKKLKDIKYKGSSKKGDLQLIAIDDDIIVQTHNSRKGDVDEMANLLSIPLKNMEPEKMDSLMQGLNYLKDK